MSIFIDYIEIFKADKFKMKNIIKNVNTDMETFVNFTKRENIDVVYKLDKNNILTIYRQLFRNYFENNLSEDIEYIIYAPSDNCSFIKELTLVAHEFKIYKSKLIILEGSCYSSMNGIIKASKIVRNKILLISDCFTNNDEERFHPNVFVSDGVGIMEINKRTGLYKIIDFMEIEDTSLNENNFLEINNTKKIVDTTANLIKKLMKKNSMEVENIDVILPHNTSKNAWILYCKKLKISEKLIFLDNIQDGGHIGGVDIIKNIESDRKKERLENSNIVLFSMGVTDRINWGGILLKRKGIMNGREFN